MFRFLVGCLAAPFYILIYLLSPLLFICAGIFDLGNDIVNWSNKKRGKNA